MTIRILDASPSLASLYAKAAIPAVPGLGALARRVGGAPAGRPVDHRVPEETRDDETLDDRTPGEVQLPDLELRLPGVSLDSGHLAKYVEVCGFARRHEVPATYPHVLAFPLHLELMTDASFPFEVLGLVHVRNRIEQRRALRVDDTIDLVVRAEKLRPHPKGSILTLVSEVVVEGDVRWRDETAVLTRHRQSEEVERRTSESAPLVKEAPAGPIRWRLPGNLGRRYAAVSGDRNPIHMSVLTARAFGFRRHIAHGMWTKARSLAALDGKVPESFSVEVEFQKPIFLPTVVSFGARSSDAGIDFGVKSGDVTHLVGRLSVR